MLVTQRGVAVNPRRPELKEQLEKAGIRVTEISRLREIAEEISGKPVETKAEGRPVATVIGRDGTVLDTIRAVTP